MAAPARFAGDGLAGCFSWDFEEDLAVLDRKLLVCVGAVLELGGGDIRAARSPANL
jgi:hypothetical protein